jgi:hypothetical protein
MRLLLSGGKATLSAGDSSALAEMLRTGWYRAVYVKSESHRLKAIRASS